MTTKLTRDAKLTEMATKIQAFAAVERARTLSEAVWLRTVQKLVGLGSVREANVQSDLSKVKAQLSRMQQ